MTPAGKILITGGAGSCGRYLTASLLGRGYEDRVIDAEEARKPLYGIVKAAAEKLCLMWGNT